MCEKVTKELKSLDIRKLSKDSLLSVIVHTLASIEETQSEVLFPSLLMDSPYDVSGDEPTDELSIAELLSAAKLIKALILDRNVPKIEAFADINNNGLKANGMTTNGMTTNGMTTNGLTINGYSNRKATDDKNISKRALVITIVRQITALKKSLNAFREILEELNDKYHETVEQMPKLHNDS